MSAIRVVDQAAEVVAVPENGITATDVQAALEELRTAIDLGGGGGGGGVYVHVQASPAATWTINHNLGFRPAIELYTTGGMEFTADVLHVSTNQALVYLVAATAGSARCN